MTNKLSLPYLFAKKFGLLLEGNKLSYETLPDISTLLEISRKHGACQLEKTSKVSLMQRIQTHYESGALSNLQDFSDNAEQDKTLDDIAMELFEPIELLDSDDQAPIISLINALCAQAILQGASDIHIEPYESRIRIRFRLNGILSEVLEPQQKIAPLLVSRIKVMANLDISERRLPQDGRIALQLGGRAVDIRVSIIPSGKGEKVVMRLLDKQVGRLQLKQLGMDDATYEQISQLIHKPNGIVLVTGPTGSGKTTTLYAALSVLNNQSRNITTIEDPIEYHIDGINQTQINDNIKMSFAKGLRAILRQDPDIVMIGEIRDQETAEIAVQASLTGHLVFSTLHTNSAKDAIIRLKDMGVEPFLLASSLSGVLAQRLIRTLCPKCKKTHTTDEKEQQRLGLDQPQVIYSPSSCGHCNHSGFSGRIGLYELLVVDDELRAMIHNGANENQISAHLDGKMLTLKDQVRTLVSQGLCSLDEAIRVISI
ncbi:General secretion pathway protein E [Bathymodiolus thermophilus thioautotrophic gill symbiont]|uniref:GspE/PulE family protein n=1 Tax=Bathymodiolus thermophilus thioautotrophic gill symbiont TaxID=2360 RepID=UPI00192C7500|nr:ATPase, T2SS/T4P/T4SS family [Bathymodiolus thermophilus thioautotrophic gill symbiont]CAB5502638.1 General secretion pathway protein E [Bathymodiolus thermophilus thioautotrophic gill symbiont]